MTDGVLFFRMLPYVSYIVGIAGSILSAYLVYSGLSTTLERRHYRLKLKKNFNKSKNKLIQNANLSKTEELLKDANYPLGLNAVRLQVVFGLILTFLVFNYGILSYFINGEASGTSLLIGCTLIIVLYPGFRYSPSSFILNKIVEYRREKRNTELFLLYDMLVSEIEMMQSSRINVYSLLRAILPYFKELHPLMTKMLSDWSSSSVGPYKAVERFAEEINSSEAKSIATVLQSFDDNSRETLLSSLQGMEDMFVSSQIENNRRKRKLFVDLVSLPVKSANFLILLNFVLVIVMMVVSIMANSKVVM